MITFEELTMVANTVMNVIVMNEFRMILRNKDTINVTGCFFMKLTEFLN